MAKQRLVIDEVIKWNLRKARTTDDPVDKARYLDNVANLKVYKEKMND